MNAEGGNINCAIPMSLQDDPWTCLTYPGKICSANDVYDYGSSFMPMRKSFLVLLFFIG